MNAAELLEQNFIDTDSNSAALEAEHHQFYGKYHFGGMLTCLSSRLAQVGPRNNLHFTFLRGTGALRWFVCAVLACSKPRLRHNILLVA